MIDIIVFAAVLSFINKIKKLLNKNSVKTSSMVHIAFDIDEGMKREFKSLCVKNDDEMSAILRKAVEEYISSKNVKIVKS